MGFNTELRTLIRESVRDEVRSAIREEFQRATPEPTPKAGSSEYLSVARAAEIAGVRPETIRSWIERGELPGHRAGRLFRIRRDELEDFLRRGPTNARGEVDLDKRASKILSKWAK